MLSELILIPAAGAIALMLWPGKLGPKMARDISVVCLSLTLVWTLVVVAQFDPQAGGLQFQEALPWVDTIGLTYRLGVDGLSLPLVVINALLTLVAVYSSGPEMRRPRLYFVMMLVLNGAVAGAFLAQNLLLFFIFYELELIPLYLLIAIWGGARRAYAATKFLIYTALSGVLILAAFIALVWFGGSTSFNYDPTLAAMLPPLQQLLLLGALVVGFGIKVPLFPFHTWLPDAHVEASTPVSVLLAGVLLKLGTYGLVRFGLQLFPDAWQVVAPWLATWAVVSVLYGSCAAIAQQDMKKMVAYSSIGHMGYVLLAAAAATPISILGVVFQMVSHGLISGLLFLLVGVVYKKTGTRDIRVLRGLLNPERGLPLIGSLMVLGGMASAGIPGMVGFISEFLVFRGSFVSFPTQTLVSMIGSGLTTVYFLLLVNRVFFGRLAITTPSQRPEPDICLPSVTWSERLPAIALAVVIVALGLQPNWMSRWSEETSIALQLPQPTAIAQTTVSASVSATVPATAQATGQTTAAATVLALKAPALD